MSGHLNKIHSTPVDHGTSPPPLSSLSISSSLPVPVLLGQVKPVLESCKDTSAALATFIPPAQFWRWKDMWTNSLRNAVFAATMVGYLETGTLLTLPQVRDVLGSALGSH